MQCPGPAAAAVFFNFYFCCSLLSPTVCVKLSHLHMLKALPAQELTLCWLQGVGGAGPSLPSLQPLLAYSWFSWPSEETSAHLQEKSKSICNQSRLSCALNGKS